MEEGFRWRIKDGGGKIEFEMEDRLAVDEEEMLEDREDRG